MQTEAVAVPPTVADPLKHHRLDLDACEEGKWVEIGGDRWLVARMGNPNVARERASALLELGLPASSEVPAHKKEWVEARIFSRAILRGCVLQLDMSRTYTQVIGEQVWSDPELRDLRDAIMAASGGDYTQEAVAKAAILGN
jgi:hypothetical protein